MGTQTRQFRQPAAVTLGVMLGSALWLASPMVSAQTSAASFDINRFSNFGEGWFETFYVDETQSLQDVLDQGVVDADTNVLVTETADGPLVLLTTQMSFHHIAQGTAGGKDWMATF